MYLSWLILLFCHEAQLAPALSGPQPPISDEFLMVPDRERIYLSWLYLDLHLPSAVLAGLEGDRSRAPVIEPRLAVIHYTVKTTLAEVLDYFLPNTISNQRTMVARKGALNVSVQFIVDRDGRIYRFMPETVMARHTIGLNHVAIGIENVGNGDLADHSASHPLTQAQLAANVALLRYLAGKYPSLRFLIGHAEYRQLEDTNHPAHFLFAEKDPSYRTVKQDPGPHFMTALRHALNGP